MGPHPMHPIHQPTSKVQVIRGERPADSSTSAVLTTIKQGASGLDLDPDLDPSLTKLPRMDLPRLRLNLLQL